MDVRRLDRASGNAPIGGRGTSAETPCNGAHNLMIQGHRAMLQTLLRHPQPNRIARMEHVRFGKANLFVPSGGPRAPLVSGEPHAVSRFYEVISEDGHVPSPPATTPNSHRCTANSGDAI